MFLWRIITPLGLPVEPDVYMITAMLSGCMPPCLCSSSGCARPIATTSSKLSTVTSAAAETSGGVRASSAVT